MGGWDTTDAWCRLSSYLADERKTIVELGWMIAEAKEFQLSESV